MRAWSRRAGSASCASRPSDSQARSQRSWTMCGGTLGRVQNPLPSGGELALLRVAQPAEEALAHTGTVRLARLVEAPAALVGQGCEGAAAVAHALAALDQALVHQP